MVVSVFSNQYNQMHPILDPCDPSPCMNDGACRNPDGIYHCLCPAGWGGLICDISNHDM